MNAVFETKVTRTKTAVDLKKTPRLKVFLLTSQVVDLNDFREAVTTFSLGLGEPEVVAFFKGFDADGSGGIDFEVGVLFCVILEVVCHGFPWSCPLQR